MRHVGDNPDEATRILESFLGLDTDNADALIALAQIARYRNRPNDARAYLQKALSADPGNPAASAELEALSSPPTP